MAVENRPISDGTVKRYPRLFASGFCLVLLISTVVFFKCTQQLSAVEVVKKYIESTTIDGRLEVVKNKEKIRQLAYAHYKDMGPLKRSYLHIVEDGRKAKNIGDWESIKVVFEIGKNKLGNDVEDSTSYEVQKTKDGFLIDWPASIGLNPMTLVAFKAQRPKETLKFRLFGKLSDYYSPESYLIGLAEKDTNESIVGLVEKNSKSGKELFSVLKDGELHPLILNVRFFSMKAAGKISMDLVQIKDFVKEGFDQENE